MILAQVIKSTGSWYLTKSSDGQIIQCRIVGKFRMDNLKLTNPVAVGDMVYIEMENETQGIIKEILPRKNYVVRQSPRKKHYVHFLASNIDQAILIATIIEPNIKPGFIDRFLIMTETYSIPVFIVFNKSDLYTEEELNIYNELKKIYTLIGYHVLLVSSKTGEGLTELKDILKDKTSLISGQSGVGKTSLINALDANLELKTQEISEFSGKGQHTTTFAEMFDLKIGGKIIDTPGIKTLGFNHLEIMDVAHNFKEFFNLSTDCKFANCTHRSEPKCAVKSALDDGQISPLRYQNYIQILDDIENQNYWEINDDI